MLQAALDITQLLHLGNSKMQLLLLKIFAFWCLAEAAKMGLAWLERSMDEGAFKKGQEAFEERFNKWRDNPPAGPRYRGQADDRKQVDEDDAWDWERVEAFYSDDPEERRAAARNKTAGNRHEWRVDEEDFEEVERDRRKRGVRRYQEETGDKPPRRRRRRRW